MEDSSRAAAPPFLPRGRGRPPAPASLPRGRGRQRQPSDPECPGGASAYSPSPRGRGRPRKIKEESSDENSNDILPPMCFVQLETSGCMPYERRFEHTEMAEVQESPEKELDQPTSMMPAERVPGYQKVEEHVERVYRETINMSEAEKNKILDQIYNDPNLDEEVFHIFLLAFGRAKIEGVVDYTTKQKENGSNLKI